MSLTSLDAWTCLEQHRDRIAAVPVRQLFTDDPARFERFSIRLDDLLVTGTFEARVTATASGPPITRMPTGMRRDADAPR